MQPSPWCPPLGPAPAQGAGPLGCSWICQGSDCGQVPPDGTALNSAWFPCASGLHGLSSQCWGCPGGPAALEPSPRSDARLPRGPHKAHGSPAAAQGLARPCVTPGARSQPQQELARRRAGSDPGPSSPACWKGSPALSDLGALPCPASHGPRRGGTLPNLLQTVWSPGLPLSRPLGPLPYRGRPLSCSAGTEFLALG